MSVINVAEAKQQIAEHERQIKLLNQLIEMADAVSGTSKSGRTAAPAKATVKRTSKASKPKRKRGVVSSTIIEIVGAAGKPIASGVIKRELTDRGIIDPGSVAVYSQLQQMSTRGTIRKTKTKKGGVLYGPARKNKK